MTTIPSRRDYTIAMQNPAKHFRDPELVNGSTILTKSGQPAVYSGRFASVFRVSGNCRDHAVRCFADDDPERQERYAALTDRLGANRPDCFTVFTYLDQEILVNGMRHPVVKMGWVQGKTLDEFVGAQRNNAGALQNLATGWLETMENLGSANIAHNDLQHGNIIISPEGRIKLVDYDGVFIPSFKGSPSPEIGHRNYQHPNRDLADYDENIDNFPALVIYLSLKAVAVAPTLWNRFRGGDDRLLFTEEDLARPDNTRLWKALADVPDVEVRRLTERLALYCQGDVSQVPSLASIVSRPPKPTRPERLTLKSTVRRGPQSTPSGGVSASSELTQSVPAQSPARARIVPPAAAAKTTRQGDACVAALSILSLLAFPGAGALTLYFLLGHLAMILTIYLSVATMSAALYFCCLDPRRPGLSVLRRAMNACRGNKRWREISLGVVVGLVGVATVGFAVHFIITHIVVVLLALLAIGLIWGFLYFLGVGRY